MSKIFTRLRALRIARGESLPQVVARVAGASLPMAYSVETGKAKAPASWRDGWAAALGIEPEKLFDDSGRTLPA